MLEPATHVNFFQGSFSSHFDFLSSQHEVGASVENAAYGISCPFAFQGVNRISPT